MKLTAKNIIIGLLIYLLHMTIISTFSSYITIKILDRTIAGRTKKAVIDGSMRAVEKMADLSMCDILLHQLTEYHLR